METTSSTSGGQGLLSLTINDVSVLYSAYMPFLRNGGLFAPTSTCYAIGDEVFMLLSLMDEPEKIPVTGQVVWITPVAPQGNRVSGIGVHFSDNDVAVKKRIEHHLAGMLDSPKSTHTL